jgi:outer membrane immunogenic protein
MAQQAAEASDTICTGLTRFGAVMKRLLATTTIVVCAAVGPAVAADLPVKAPPMAPVVAYDWTGFYVGINGGYGWADASAVSIPGDLASVLFFTQSGVSGPAFTAPFASSFQQKGALGGGQVGYNWQIAPRWLAGFEADLQAADVTGSSSDKILLQPGMFGPNFPFLLNGERTLDWFGTVRGRVGALVNPNLLLYGTGGLAFGETKTSGSIVLAPPPGVTATLSFSTPAFTFFCTATGPATSPCDAGSGSRTSIGFAVGAGAEYHLWGNLTAKLEYLHVDLGAQSVTLVSPSPPSTSGVFTNYVFNREQVNIVRVGLNYKFGGPVIAKY